MIIDKVVLKDWKYVRPLELVERQTLGIESKRRPEYVVGTDNEHQTQWRDQALAYVTANMHTCVCIFTKCQ